MQRLISNLPKSLLSTIDQTIWDTYVRNHLQANTQIIPRYHNHTTPQTLKLVLDLHGLTIHQAFATFKDFLYEHTLLKTKTIKIITGKSGQIYKELPIWCENLKSIARLQPIFDQANQSGAYQIWLKHK